MHQKEKFVWEEMVRRKLTFHKDKDWQTIRLWSLFNWGDVSKLIEHGKLLTTMSKENKIVWVCPSPEAYVEHIKPLLDEVERLEKLRTATHPEG